jgi:murein DD-endopeptidase MepM/ murein hydrolase activator NlpD
MRKFKRVFSVLLCVCLTAAVTVNSPIASYDVSALSYSEVQDKIQGYEAKQKELQGKIDSLKKDSTKYEELKESLDKQISSMQSQIDMVNSRISSLTDKISKTEAEIKQKKSDLDETKQLLRDRLRAVYVAGHSSELLVLLSADNFADMLASTQLMRSVTEHDTALMENIQKEIKSIKKKQKEIEKEKMEATSLKSTLVTKQQQLDRQYKEASSVLSSMESKKDSLEAQKEDVIQAQKEAEAEWAEAQRQLAAQQQQQFNPSAGAPPASTGIFGWPFQSSYYISSGYGYRWGGVHTGIDITCSGAYGKPVYAAASGTVLTTKHLTYSYGNYIIINHGVYDGNSYQTLYAHNSSLLVSPGQHVSRGQLIAYCGNSGNSTGAHLHFEIRVNGSHVNPMNYFR